MDYSDSSTFSTASGKDYQYVVLQVTLKEKFLGTGSGNRILRLWRTAGASF